MKIRQALISLSDKRNAVDFARGLQSFGVTLLSTGGTARILREAGLAVTEIGDYTGFPEILDGRVKTLHPKIHGGILARRDLPEHMEALKARGIGVIDLVCVNLYPFRETIAKADVTLECAIENIDIGGPSLIRASAKNYPGVAVLTDPEDYAKVLEEMRANDGGVTEKTRFALAKKAFVHTARYDAAIANWLSALDENAPEETGAVVASRFPASLQLAFDRAETLRYGENPHQAAAFYRDENAPDGAFSMYRQIQGKTLSYNNIADADAALSCVNAFESPACVIVKHANPCGVALAENAAAAYERAFKTDPTSAFGGILAFNRVVDADTVAAINARQHFVEVLIAPGFTPSARALLSAKQNLRVLEIPVSGQANAYDLKRVGGGLLAQTPDNAIARAKDLTIVTQTAPTREQIEDMLFAFSVAHFVKSNAIVFAGDKMTLGIGAGQMSRVDSTRIACLKAEAAGLSLRGACVASDAFFPFRDGLDVLAKAGAKAVIQPGGSVRDEEVIAAANEQGIAMVFTGIRHFRH